MAKSMRNYTSGEASNVALGQAGVILIDDTVEHVGPFVAVTALDGSAVVDVSECDVTFITDPDVDFAIPVGATIYGKFASICLTGGRALAYYSGA